MAFKLFHAAGMEWSFEFSARIWRFCFILGTFLYELLCHRLVVITGEVNHFYRIYRILVC